MLMAELGLDGATVDKVLGLAEIRGNDASVVQRVKALGVTSELLEQGLDELHFVMRELERFPEGTFVADLSIARGLAYYTGTVYESRFTDFRISRRFAAAGAMTIWLAIWSTRGCRASASRSD